VKPKCEEEHVVCKELFRSEIKDVPISGKHEVIDADYQNEFKTTDLRSILLVTGKNKYIIKTPDTY
jgi:hypothetical protein